MANKTKIKEMTMPELLAYKNGCEIIFDYYDNLMRANYGTYDSYTKKAFNDSSEKCSKYIKIKEEIFNEIKAKIDNLVC